MPTLLVYTRAIINAIHDGSMPTDPSAYEKLPVFGLSVPKSLANVPQELLNPANAWPDRKGFEAEVTKLAGMFKEAFQKYEVDVAPEVLAAGPQL